MQHIMISLLFPRFSSPHPSRGTAFYQATIEDVQLNGVSLSATSDVPYLFSAGYGTVVDSGTTFTYLPAPIFEDFKRKVGRLGSPIFVRSGAIANHSAIILSIL